MKNSEIINVVNKVHSGSQIDEALKLTRWYHDGLVNHNNFTDLHLSDYKNSGSGGFFQTLVEQEAALLFSRLPDYEVQEENSKIKELIIDFIKENELLISKELNKAVLNYVLYGAAVIEFYVENESLTLKSENPVDITFDLKSNEYIAKKGYVKSESIISKKLVTTEVIQININNGSRIYVNNANKVYKLSTIPNTFSAAFNTKDHKIQSNLLKVQSYLNSHERLTNLMLEAQKALLVKGFVEESHFKLYDQLYSNKSVEIIKYTASANDNNIVPFQWISNDSLMQNLEAIINQIALLEEKIYQVLGLTEIFQGRDVVNQNETTIEAMDRSEKANILWRAKEQRISNFVSDVLNKLIKNLLFTKGINKDITLHIESDNIGLLANKQREAENQQALSNIVGMLDKALSLVPTGNTGYISLLKQIATSQIQTSNFKNKMISEIEAAFNEAINNAEIAKQQQQMMLQMQNQNQPPPLSPIEEQKLQQGQLQMTKTALDIKKAQNDIANNAQNVELKNLEINEKATGFEWLVKALKGIVTRKKHQNQLLLNNQIPTTGANNE